ncbi:uncharacterized protein TNCV_1724771 [Trichonephila clavipes]|nr:uncharacterized protein TNCV_1724771 [Trichonephila clavipes]
MYGKHNIYNSMILTTRRRHFYLVGQSKHKVGACGVNNQASAVLAGNELAFVAFSLSLASCTQSCFPVAQSDGKETKKKAHISNIFNCLHLRRAHTLGDKPKKGAKPEQDGAKRKRQWWQGNIAELGSNPGQDMDVCKCIVPLRHGDILNSHRVTSPVVRLVEGEVRWEAPDHPQGVLPQNCGETQHCHLHGDQSYG